MKNRWIYLIGIITLAQGCSTASVRVMPGEEHHTVVARDIERDDAEEAAVDAANEFCEDRNKSAVFKSEKTGYHGDMDESTRKTVRNASKAAWMLGGVGTPVSQAGSAGRMMTSDRDYKSEIRFKCL